MIPLSMENDAAAGMLHIAWDDGTRQLVSHQAVRKSCRCAHCQARRLTGQAVIGDEARLADIRPVGIYAVQFVFADGHERGIFPWTLLKTIAG